ncbi:MAG TPA: carbamoyl-phosphate synthase large subunit [Planctomycetia bacterium]|nr:carbamoyl-phosphate synthase large subunit [Planctomycetia bacterium]
MPKRTDIRTILVIGSGPIVIGQACEFDYSGTQACKALREEGYRIVLANSNPATIMTDPETADRTYIEPLTVDVLTKIIAAEKPDALLPTLGGQTALNLAFALHEKGVLTEHGVEMIGANAVAIKRAEDREEFKETMERIGIETPKSVIVRDEKTAITARETIGLPCVVRPAFTMGGQGGGIAYNRQEYDAIIERGLDLSPIREVLVEESVIGWKEFEMEVMRDRADNVVIVCSIENFDPMGVHTGDSITVAPQQTLTDKEYQRMRDASIAVIRAIGVETGGSNIQFAVDPKTGRMVAIEMNPRVSRSSALASKATGFPIAKIAAKLAVGYRLDEIRNDITQETPACFEPTIDYVVVKTPRFTFEKFPDTSTTLTTAMKSIGEAMAIGGTFKEALQKAVRSLETGHYGYGLSRNDPWIDGPAPERDTVVAKLSTPTPDRLLAIRDAFKLGLDVDEIHRRSGIDPWFLDNIRELVTFEDELIKLGRLAAVTPEMMRRAKQLGYADRQLAKVWHCGEMEVRRRRKEMGVVATFRLVDTCAAEFAARTPYYYSTYDSQDETKFDETRRRVMILGGGPNRIGQGIEFDYCCCHAAFALEEEGYESVMVNSNPETVSTDYDTSDQLFFEPLTVEDVLNIWERAKPMGLIAQFGGQTPLNLARALDGAGVKILGTSPDSIDLAEDRERFHKLIARLGIKQPPGGIATSAGEAQQIASRLGYPVLVRPSYVLGGRAMAIVDDDADLLAMVDKAMEAAPEQKILVDKFLEDAVEVDVDALSDGKRTIICGVMEHIEEAGIHSGDSACALPPFSLQPDLIERVKAQSRALAKELKVVGLMNIQFAIKDDEIFVLEVNPRASRSMPFVSKATGLPLAKLAAKIMVGKTLDQLGVHDDPQPTHVSVKESTFPFNRFPGTDLVLGPEMRSTGEVMGIDDNFAMAFAKSQIAAGTLLPAKGKIFVSLADRDKAQGVALGRRLADLGFHILSTSGTAAALAAAGVPVTAIHKIQQGRPNILDYMLNQDVALIFNTPSGRRARTDDSKIRAEAVTRGVPCITTLSAAFAAVKAIAALRDGDLKIKALQDWHKG